MLGLTLLILTAITADPPLVTEPATSVVTGFRFTEGPVWCGSEGWLFSDIPADTIFHGDGAVFRCPSGEANGLTLDREGRLIACEHKNRRVTRTEKDGSITVIAERVDGKRLNSPNDVIVRSDGLVFFTDPAYGLPGGLDGPDGELHFTGVYRVRPGEAVQLAAKGFMTPNGLALSPDEKILYVADTENKHIRAFTVAADGALSDGKVVYTLPGPDGMKVDTKGNLWCTAADGVHIVGPDGHLLQRINVPEVPANGAFGGKEKKTFYITARTSVYKVESTVPGITPGKP